MTTIIGTDISLDECKREGYMMMEYEEGSVFDKDKQYDIFCYYPEYLIKESKGTFLEGAKAIDTTVSWNECLRLYKKHETGINKFADDMKAIMRKHKPLFSDLLAAADTLNIYCGLD